MDLKVIIQSEGLSLEWNDVSSNHGWSKYSLVLKNGGRFLYYGGHGWNQAEINYKNFSLDGTEVLNGYFVESNPVNGEWVSNHPAFQIDLNEFPLKVERFGDLSNKIKFKFVEFSDRQKSQYLEFIQRVIPIINQVMGVPSESFICEFIMNEESSNSWVTLNHGREIHLDDN